MSGLFFAAAGLGFLLYFEKEKTEGVSLRNFSGFIKEGAGLFAVSILLALACYWILPALPWEPIRQGEFSTFLLPLSYAFHQTLKKSWAFYLAAAGFSFAILEKSQSFSDCLYFSAWLAATATIFQILLGGVRSRLVFSPVKGPAFLFFAAAVIALILNSIPVF